MRIVLVPNVFWPLYGGVVTWTDNLAKHFVEAGHHVAVIVHRPRPDLPAYDKRHGFEIYRVEFSARGLARRLTTFPRALFRIYRILRQFQPDIVHVQFLHINTLYPLVLSYLSPYTLILRACGNDIHRFAAESWLFRELIRWGFRRAHQIQFNSVGLQQDAAPLLRGMDGKIAIVGDGADPDEFNAIPPYVPEAGRPYIFTLGRFVHKKGFDLLIHAFAEVRRDYPDMQLIVGGDGEEMPALKALVETLALQSSVQLVGYLDRARTGAYLKGCKLFVLPSRIEPVGIVTLEALMVGKPVLATAVGGVPDIVEHGRSGWLAPPESSALSAGMRHLLRHPDLMRELAQNGLERARAHFTWRKIADDCLQAYQQALAARSAGSLE